MANRSDARFCGECGATLGRELNCGACGQANDPGNKFCNSCGAQLRSAPTEPMATTRADRGTSQSPPKSFGSGRYEVVRFLGEGGRKRVYLARDTQLGREVAVSALKTEGIEAGALLRARREAEAMGRLGDHPNIVTIHDIGEEHGELFLVSQYMAGGDLGQLQAQAPDRRLEIDEALRISTQIAQALEYAHAQQIVHRDLKPQNVWLTPDGTAKLGDFGLALAAEQARVTVEGMMVGTVAYMPPEQGLGRPADARSDLYSLGVVIYELLCGAPPFTGEDAAAVISQHVSGVPLAPSWQRPDVPKVLEQVVLKLLAKAPGDRFQDATDLRKALAAIGSAATGGPLADRPDDPLDRFSSGPLLGRQRETRELRTAVDEALAGRRRIALLAGDAGIGKSRLAAEIESYAELRGAKVLWGRCHEGEGAPAYWPWVQVIRSYAQTREPEELRSELGSGASDIAHVVSELRERLPDLHEPQSLDAEQARFRLFDSIATFLRNASNKHPLAIFIEDLHLADQPSVLLLQFLARELSDSRMLVLSTYRDGEVDESHPLSAIESALSHERGFTRVRLDGLSERDVKALLEHISGQAMESTDELALAKAVYEESEGNPYFIEEIIRHLVESGAIFERDGRWVSEARHISELGIPQSIRDVIGRRLGRRSDECRDLLAAASAIGAEFGVATLCQITGSAADEAAALIDEAAEAGLVTALPDDPGRYRFAHVATRDALYQASSPTRKAELHRSIGEALEELYEDRIESHLGELAHHFAAAAPAGLAEKAAEYAWWAGERAASLAAYEDAVYHYTRAIGLFDTLSEEPTRRCELLLALGEVCVRAGDVPRSNELCLEAAAIAERLSLAEQYARAALGYGGGLGGLSATNLADGKLIELLRGALDALPERDSALRVRVTARLAVELSFTSDEAEPDLLGRAAVEMAERLGETGVLLIAMYSREWAAMRPDRIEEARAAGEEIVRLARLVGDLEMEFRGHHLLLNALLGLGDTQAVDRQIRACDKLAKALRQPVFEWQALIFRTMRALMHGRFDEGERLAQAAFDAGQRGQGEVAAVIFGAHQFFIRWAAGTIAELAEGGEALAAAYPDSAWPAALTMLYSESEDAHKARAALDALAGDGFAGIRRDANWLTAMGCLSITCHYLKDAEAAGRLYEMLLPHADAWTSVLAGAATFGVNHTFLGVYALTAGRLDTAVEHFERAFEVQTRSGGIWILTIVCRMYAESLIARDRPGDSERAADVVKEGLRVARKIGAQKEVERLLAFKLEREGLAAIDVQTSIDAVAESVERSRPDISPATAPDGTVTIMFSDIEDSTVLTEKLGDRRWLELLGRHNEIFRSRLAKHDGFEVKSQGDGFMLAFASARKALLCAIEVQRALADHREAHPEDPLRVRIGLHTGEALRTDEDFFGKNVILAARIAARAGGDEILVSSLMRELVSSTGDFNFADEREFDLKGLTGRYRVSRLVWSGEPEAPMGDDGGGATSVEPLLPAALRDAPTVECIGRGRERAKLEEQLRAATDGGLRAVLIGGEPGIGKTCLAREFALRAHAGGATLLHGACDREGDHPYGPWAQALGPFVAGAPDAVLAAHAARYGGQLARLLPELATRLPEGSDPIRSSESEVERYLAFGAVVDLIGEAARVAPVVIVLEDLHDADRSSMALLGHLVATAVDTRVLVLATFRSSEITAEHRLASEFDALSSRPEASRIDLEGLDEDDLVMLIRGGESDDLPTALQRLAADLHRETDGNPFFATELLRHLEHTGGIERNASGGWTVIGESLELELPASVRELITERLAALGDECSDVLAAAAVLGSEFGVDELSRVTGRDVEEVLTLLERAVSSSLLCRSSASAGHFGFAQTLVNHTLYQDLGAPRRAELHQRAGEALEKLDADGGRAAELARHWLAAPPEASGQKPLRYCLAAGRRALGELAPHEARSWFRRALRRMERQPNVDAALRCDLLIGLGDAQRHVGDAGYRETLLQACERARELADGGRLARAALANNRGWTSTVGDLDKDRVAALEDALALVDEGSAAIRARLLAQLGVERVYAGDLRARKALSDEALTLARQSGDERALAFVLGRRYLTIWAPETLADRLDNVVEFETVAARLRDPMAEFGAASWRFLGSLEAGDVRAAATALDHKEALANRIGRPVMRWEALFQRSALAYLAGRLDVAESLATQAFEIGKAQPEAAAILAAQLVAVRYDQGRLHEFEAVFIDAARRNSDLSTFNAAVALMHCELDHPDEARKALARDQETGFEQIPLDFLWLTTVAAYADAVAQLGDSAPAAVLYALLAPFAERLATNGPNANGSIALRLGMLASTCGRSADADRHFAAAVDIHERIGAPIFLARTQLEWGRSLLGRADGTDLAPPADKLLQAALATARAHGCAVLERRIEAQLDAVQPTTAA